MPLEHWIGSARVNRLHQGGGINKEWVCLLLIPGVNRGSSPTPGEPRVLLNSSKLRAGESKALLNKLQAGERKALLNSNQLGGIGKILLNSNELRAGERKALLNISLAGGDHKVRSSNNQPGGEIKMQGVWEDNSPGMRQHHQIPGHNSSKAHQHGVNKVISLLPQHMAVELVQVNLGGSQHKLPINGVSLFNNLPNKEAGLPVTNNRQPRPLQLVMIP